MINPALQTCAVCGEPNAYPFRFALSAPDRAALKAHERKQAAKDHAEQQALGYTGGPQFTWNRATEVLLCTHHRDRVAELGLLEVPMEETLRQLRVDAGLPAHPKSPPRAAAPTSLWDRCLAWWRGR